MRLWISALQKCLFGMRQGKIYPASLHHQRQPWGKEKVGATIRFGKRVDYGKPVDGLKEDLNLIVSKIAFLETAMGQIAMIMEGVLELRIKFESLQRVYDEFCDELLDLAIDHKELAAEIKRRVEQRGLLKREVSEH